MKMLQLLGTCVLFLVLPSILAVTLLWCTLRANGVRATLSHIVAHCCDAVANLPMVMVEHWVERGSSSSNPLQLLVGWPLMLIMMLLDE